MKSIPVVALLIAAFAGCGGGRSPSDTAAAFMDCLVEEDIDGAREYLTRDQRDGLEEFCEGKKILSYSIGGVSISEDGRSATVEWNMSIHDENSADTDEGNEFLLELTDDGDWLISDLEHEGYY
jgi:hypothetical protein